MNAKAGKNAAKALVTDTRRARFLHSAGFALLGRNDKMRPVRLRGSRLVRRSAQGDKNCLFPVILRSAATKDLMPECKM